MIIFELDGVLADIEHRRHFVDPKFRKDVYYHPNDTLHQGQGWSYKDKGDRTFEKHFEPDRQAFYEACGQDKPIFAMELLLNDIAMSDACRHIELWTSRCESLREKTIEWINYHLGHAYLEGALDDYIYVKNLKMRPISDDRPAHEIKERWLDDLECNSYCNLCFNNTAHLVRPCGNCSTKIKMVFESDPESIAMYRKHGIFVFDCRQT